MARQRFEHEEADNAPDDETADEQREGAAGAY
jgi:hypothetical protein